MEQAGDRAPAFRRGSRIQPFRPFFSLSSKGPGSLTRKLEVMCQTAEFKVKMTPILPRLFLLLAATFGCRDRALLQEASIATDSAGVRIVENLLGTWTVPWQVGVEPLLTIGSIGGNPDQELDQVTGALGLTGDRIVVANGGRFELLFYDADGNLLRRAGGRGDGPGEFQSLEWISRFGSDSILALDVWGQRVSYFDAAGSFGRSVRLEPTAQLPFPRPVAFLGGGGFLATQGTFALGGDPPAGRAERRLEPLYHISSDGLTATLVGSFPGRERVIVPTGPRGGLERRQRPFGRGTAFAATYDRFYVADNESYEIRAYTIAGKLTQVIRKQAVPIPLDASDIQAFEDSVLATVSPASRPQMRVLFATMPPPPRTYPAFEPDIHIDGDLNLWVKESNRLGDPRSEWSVFSAGGELRGVVEMPHGIEVLDIGVDYVLGLRRDELDVEYVQLFQLRRGR